ncbi:MAG: serine hydrolase domain-containing protein [Actinomycetota bacterium]
MHGNGTRRAGMAAALCLAAALMLVSVSSCGTSRFDASLERTLSDKLSRSMEKFDIPGAVVGIKVPGKGEWTEARGKADIETGAAMKAPLRFRVGSITKSFTTTLILMLVDEGRLSLDNHVSEYVEGIPHGEDITIRMLCNNTSGLFNYGEDPAFVQRLYADPHHFYSPRELVDFAVSHPPYFELGDGWHYSNTNFILLGMMIEKITGNGVASEYDRRIIEPLGLKDTYFAEGYRIEGAHAHGYEEGQDGGGGLEDRTEFFDMSVDWTAGAMVSNLRDLQTWAGALGEGELLEPATHREQLSWVEMPDSGGLSRYGLGIFTMKEFLGHDGMVPGYNCSMFYLPRNGATVVVLLNRSQVDSLALTAFMGLSAEVLPEDADW